MPLRPPTALNGNMLRIQTEDEPDKRAGAAWKAVRPRFGAGEHFLRLPPLCRSGVTGKRGWLKPSLLRVRVPPPVPVNQVPVKRGVNSVAASARQLVELKVRVRPPVDTPRQRGRARPVDQARLINRPRRVRLPPLPPKSWKANRAGAPGLFRKQYVLDRAWGSSPPSSAILAVHLPRAD